MSGASVSVWHRLALGVAALILTVTAQAGGFRHHAAVDLVGVGLLAPTAQYEYRPASQWSVGGRLGTRLQALDEGIQATPFVRFAPWGTLRSGFWGELGMYLPTSEPLAAEAGLGYALWVDRMQITPALAVRSTGELSARLTIGYGWY